MDNISIDNSINSYFIRKNTSDSIQSTPYWIALAIPFKDKITFNSVTLRTFEQFKIGDPVETIKPRFLEDDCINWQISSSKESPVGMLSFVLSASAYEYIDELAPEDWIVFWAFDSEDDYISVKSKLQKLINNENVDFVFEFKNAPKIVAQISNIGKNESIDGIGTIDVSFTISAQSFSPLMGSQYFDQRMRVLSDNVSFWWERFASLDTAQASSFQGIISAQKAIISLFAVLLGRGPGNSFKNPVFDASSGEFFSGKDLTTFVDLPAPLLAPDPPRISTPNEEYRIPTFVAKIFLGSQATSKFLSGDKFVYADLLNLWIGIQTYGSFGAGTEFAVSTISENNLQKGFSVFIPSNLKAHPTDGIPTAFQTDAPLLGTSYPQPLMFNNESNWSILNNYTHRPVNEMYTAMRPTPEGRVLPTLICRQVPLTIGNIDTLLSQDLGLPGFSSSTGLLTNYGSLPTWDIDPAYVRQLNVGLSGQMRYNYISLMPMNGLQNDMIGAANAQLLELPIYDETDVKRNGLRGYISQIQTVWGASSVSQQKAVNGFFNRIMANMMFNSHLKLTGTAVLHGIVEPIQPGDNVLINGVTYHIESVTYSGGVSGAGHKNFVTQLKLSNGLIVKTDLSIEYPKLSTISHGVNKG